MPKTSELTTRGIGIASVVAVLVCSRSGVNQERITRSRSVDVSAVSRGPAHNQDLHLHPILKGLSWEIRICSNPHAVELRFFCCQLPCLWAASWGRGAQSPSVAGSLPCGQQLGGEEGGGGGEGFWEQCSPEYLRQPLHAAFAWKLPHI